MTNDSSTGGYLTPDPTTGPLEGKELMRFLQQVVMGITSINGDLVRPRWQAEPPNIPQSGTSWVAMGITERPSDTNAYIKHFPDGHDELQRHEELNILCSFYDTGYDGQADANCAVLRDGLQVPQNREVLFLAGMGLIDTGIPVAVPSLLKTRWLYRVDMPWRVRRIILRTYPVRNVLSLNGVLIANPPGTDATITQTLHSP